MEGNASKRPLPEDEPTPVRGVPPRPTWLSKSARRYWRGITETLDKLEVLTVADGAAVALLCEALAEQAAARAVIEATGATYEAQTQTGSAIVRQRPEVAMAADAWRRASAMLQQFGLTPASRTRVRAVPDNPPDPFDEFLNRRGKNSVSTPNHFGDGGDKERE